MSKMIWFVFDRNLNYAEKLTDFFTGKQPLHISMETFSEEAALQKRIGNEEGDWLLVATESSLASWMPEEKLAEYGTRKPK